MKTNVEFKAIALNALRGNWGKAVIATLIFVLIASAISSPATYGGLQLKNQMDSMAGVYSSGSVYQMASTMATPEFIAAQSKATSTGSLTTILEILLLLPLSLGFTNAFRMLLIMKDNQVLTNTFGLAFRNYWHNVWGMFLTGLFIALWSLLLIIPGIIKAFSYAMTPYILVEYPELSASEAIHRSRMMMRGHKFDLFWLYLGFIGWFLLCLLTAGIGFLWLSPYVETAKAAFYEEVKADYALNGGLY